MKEGNQYAFEGKLRKFVMKTYPKTMAKEIIYIKGMVKNFGTLGKNKGKRKNMDKCSRLSFFKLFKLYSSVK